MSSSSAHFRLDSELNANNRSILISFLQSIEDSRSRALSRLLAHLEQVGRVSGNSASSSQHANALSPPLSTDVRPAYKLFCV